MIPMIDDGGLGVMDVPLRVKISTQGSDCGIVNVNIGPSGAEIGVPLRAPVCMFCMCCAVPGLQGGYCGPFSAVVGDPFWTAVGRVILM